MTRNLKQSPVTLYRIVKGPNRWDLMMALFDENREGRTVTFVIDTHPAPRAGQERRDRKLIVQITSLGVPKDDEGCWTTSDDFVVGGIATKLKLLNVVIGKYNAHSRSGYLSFAES